MKKKMLLCTVLLLYLFLMFVPIIVDNKGIFIFYGDSYEQLYHYFTGAWQKVHLGLFGGFDFSIGLGANFLSTTFYSITPFFCLMLLLPLAFVKYSFLYLTILKVFFIFIFTSMWMGELTDNKKSRIIGTIVFSFSGWVIFYMIVGFLDFFAFYPLVLWGTEKYLKQAKILPLVLSLAALCVSNYYFGYMFIPFLCMYALYRYLMLQEKNQWKDTLIAATKFFGFVLLSVGLSAFALLPNAFIILQEPRLDAELELFSHIHRIDLFHLFSSLYSPVMNRFDVNLYVDESLHSFMGWNGGSTLFAGMIVPLMIPLIIGMKNKKERTGLLVFYGVLLMFASFFAFYRLFQGTIESRWFYMFAAVHAISTVRVTEELFGGKISKRGLCLSCLLTIIAVTFIYFYSTRNQLYISEYASLVKKTSFITLVFACLITFCFLLPKKIQWFTIIFVLLLENMVYFHQFLKTNPPMEASVVFTADISNRSVIQTIDEMENGFYRIMYGGVECTTQNEPNAKAFAGTTFYSSLYNYAQEDYLERFKSTWSSPQAYGRFKALNLLGTKYYYTFAYYQPPEWGYKYLKSDDITGIYKNQYSYGLGYATNQIVSDEAVKRLSFFDQDRLLMDHIAVAESNQEVFSYSDKLIDLGVFEGDEVVVELGDHLTDFVVHVVYPTGARFKIDAYGNYDDSLVTSNYFWQLNYTSVYYPDYRTVNKIHLDLLDEDFSSFHVYLEKPQDTYPQMYEELSKQMFYDVSYDQDEVHAKIDIHEKDAIAFTNIPVDEGWRVWIDNEEIEPMKVNLGFIGFELSEGTHEIEMRYTLPWLKEGIMISVASSILFALILYVKKKAE